MPEFVEVTGVEPQLAARIRAYFTDQVNRPLRTEEVEAGIEEVKGTNAFAYIGYGMIERDKRPGLSIYVHPAANQPPLFQPAVVLDGFDARNTRFAGVARLTALNLGGFRSEWRNTLVLGSSYGVGSEYFRPLTAFSHWFVAPRAYVRTEPLDIYRKSRILALYRRKQAGGGIDFGYQFGNISELRLGYESSYRSVSSIGDTTASYPTLHGRYGATSLSWILDRVDEEIVPHSGVHARAAMRWLDANPGFKQGLPVFDGSVRLFRPLSSSFTFFESMEGGTAFNKSNPGVSLFFLGSPGRLSAYGRNELHGDQYFLNRLGVFKQIKNPAPITDGRIYLLCQFEVAKVDGYGNSRRVPLDVNAGVIVRTILGPLFLGGSIGDSGHRKWFFQLGPVF